MNRSELFNVVRAVTHISTAPLEELLLLAEAMIAAKLRTAEQVTVADLDLVTAVQPAPGLYELPTDFVQLTAASIGECKLVTLPYADLVQYSNAIGQPRYMAVVEKMLAVAPNDGASTIRLVYFRRPTALAADEDTNPIITAWPDVYVRGLAAEVMGWAQDTERQAAWLQLFQESIDAVNESGWHQQFAAGLKTRQGRQYNTRGALN